MNKTVLFKTQGDLTIYTPVWLLACIVTLSLISGRAKAQTIFLAGPEALGEAGRAANVAIDSHFLNPAGLAFSHGVNIGGAFQESAPYSGTPTNNYALVITDNEPEKFAAGSFGYVTKRYSYSDHIVSDQDLSIDVGAHLTETISVGFQEHRLVRRDTAGPDYTRYNTTVGFLAVPRPWIGLALVGYDLFGDDAHVTIPTLAFGTHIIIMDLVRIRADVTHPEAENPLNGSTLNTGVEFDLNNGFFLRTGALWDSIVNTRAWTGGLAWEGPNLSVAYSYKADIDTPDNYTHTFQAWLNF